MANAMNVADFIISEANQSYNGISNLKLQKVMYFLNVVYLLKNHKPLITDNQFEKWYYGPVIHNVYSEYSKFGGSNISKPVKHIKSFNIDNGNICIVDPNKCKNEGLDKKSCQFIRHNIQKFMKYTPFELVEYSHKEIQWKKRKNPFDRHELYNNQEIINFYSQRKHQFWNLKDES